MRGGTDRVNPRTLLSTLRGIRALKASQGVPDYQVNRDASRQEMRTYRSKQVSYAAFQSSGGSTLAALRILGRSVAN
jgi:hypothetical protein